MGWVSGGDPEGDTSWLERNLFDQIQYHDRLGKNFDEVLSAATRLLKVSMQDKVRITYSCPFSQKYSKSRPWLPNLAKNI